VNRGVEGQTWWPSSGRISFTQMIIPHPSRIVASRQRAGFQLGCVTTTKLSRAKVVGLRQRYGCSTANARAKNGWFRLSEDFETCSHCWVLPWRMFMLASLARPPCPRSTWSHPPLWGEWVRQLVCHRVFWFVNVSKQIYLPASLVPPPYTDGSSIHTSIRYSAV